MDSLCKLGWKQRCLRRNECRELTRQQIDLAKGVLSIPMTKNGKPHSLPITPMMREILERRCLVSVWARHLDRAADSGLRLPAVWQQFLNAAVHV